MRFLAPVMLAILCHCSLHARDLPKTQIKDVNSGKKIAFNDAFPKGRVTLVTFWGTWCAPGKREIKTILLKMPEWKKQADFDYITIAENQHQKQHDEERVRTYALAHKWNFPCYVDPNSELKQAFGFSSLPYTLIIDKDGKIAYTHSAYEEGEKIIARLKQLAGK